MSNLNNRLEYIAKKIFYAIVMLSSASYCVEVIKHLKKAADWRPFCFYTCVISSRETNTIKCKKPSPEGALLSTLPILKPPSLGTQSLNN